MSRIYFHAKDHDAAELRGSERAYMGCLASDIMLAVLGDLYHAEAWLKPLFREDCYVRKASGHEFARQAATLLRVGWGNEDNLRLPNGDQVDAFTLALNTMFIAGSDPLRLLARLHGQCEVHCWIEGEADKTWIADIIDAGLATEVMRPDQGWDNVTALLRQPGDFPVVCSYSVCEQFPNFGCLPADHPLHGRTDDDRWEDFDKIDHGERWDLCMAGLKASKGGLRITRSDWGKFYFGHGISAFNLYRRATEGKAAA